MVRVWFVIAVLLVAAPLARASEPVVADQATPVLWTVERGGKTLYLFGSIHLLPPEMKWKRAEIERAREAAQVFVFEAPLEEGGQAMAKFVEEGGKLPAGRTLKDVLPAALHADMEKAAWQVQYPPKLLAPLRPWLAAVYLELYAYLNLGFSSYYGVDHVIEEEAKARRAEFAYFETVGEQLAYFARLKRRTEVAYLRATVRGVLEQPNLPVELLNAWAQGRTGELARLVDEGFKDVPELRTQLIVTRNRKWLPRLRQMIASDKTHFVTVGVGHLVGRDSLIALLRAKGYKVTGP
jgi:uncharacterized protein YbaP (TraB family)